MEKTKNDVMVNLEGYYDGCYYNKEEYEALKKIFNSLYRNGYKIRTDFYDFEVLKVIDGKEHIILRFRVYK